MTSPTIPVQDDAVTITLGNEVFLIPPLPLGVTKKTVPMLMKLRHVSPDHFEEEDFDRMVDILFLAAQAGKPALKKEAFYQLAATTSQIKKALEAVAQQSGLERPEQAKVGVPGEAIQNPQTSTE